MTVASFLWILPAWIKYQSRGSGQGSFLGKWARSVVLFQIFFQTFHFNTRNMYGTSAKPGAHQFSHSVMSDSLRPHGLQHARPPCPSPTPGVYSNSCPLSQWCHPTFSSSVVPFFSGLQSFPESGFFSNESVLRIRWPKYWSFSFSISPSDEYPGRISFRMGWFDLLVIQETLKSLLQQDGSKALILWHSAFLWSNFHILTWLLEKP